MTNPTVVDRRGLSRDAVADSVEALHSARDPVIVERDEAEALEDCKRGLREIVGASLGVDDATTEAMGAKALANYVQNVGKEDQPTLSTLSQSPETGSGPDIDPSNASPSGVEALDSSERNDLRSLVDKHDLLEGRTPEHCASLQEDAVSMVPGVEDFETLREELDDGR